MDVHQFGEQGEIIGYGRVIHTTNVRIFVSHECTQINTNKFIR